MCPGKPRGPFCVLILRGPKAAERCPEMCLPVSPAAPVTLVGHFATLFSHLTNGLIGSIHLTGQVEAKSCLLSTPSKSLRKEGQIY